MSCMDQVDKERFPLSCTCSFHSIQGLSSVHIQEHY